MLRAIIHQYRQAYSGLPRAVWVLAGTLFINRSGSMVLPFLAIYLTKQLGADPSVVGWVLAAHGIGAVIGANLGGKLSQWISYHSIQVGSLLLAGGGFLVLSTLRSPSSIAVAYLFISTVNEAFRPANGAAVASACSAADRPRAMALVRMAINLGMTASPAIGGLLASIDYFWIFIADGGTCLLAGVFMALVPYDRRGGGRQSQAGSQKATSPWRDRRLIILMAICFPSMLIFFQLFTTWPVFLIEERGLSEWRFGLLMTISTSLIVAVEMVLAHHLGRVSAFRVIGYGCLFTGLGLALLPVTYSYLAITVSVVVWTLGEMLFSPFLSSQVANMANDANRGTYMGVFVLFFSLAWVFAPVLGMACYQAWGADVLWLLCGVISLIQFILLLIWAQLETVAPGGQTST